MRLARFKTVRGRLLALLVAIALPIACLSAIAAITTYRTVIASIQSFQIRTADDFIAKVASKSSTTGRPYLVRFSDGREVPTADFFRAELAKLR